MDVLVYLFICLFLLFSTIVISIVKSYYEEELSGTYKECVKMRYEYLEYTEKICKAILGKEVIINKHHYKQRVTILDLDIRYSVKCDKTEPYYSWIIKMTPQYASSFTIEDVILQNITFVAKTKKEQLDIEEALRLMIGVKFNPNLILLEEEEKFTKDTASKNNEYKSEYDNLCDLLPKYIEMGEEIVDITKSLKRIIDYFNAESDVIVKTGFNGKSFDDAHNSCTCSNKCKNESKR